MSRLAIFRLDGARPFLHSGPSASISFSIFGFMSLAVQFPASNPLQNPLAKNQVLASSLGNTQSAKANFAGQAVFGQAKGNSGLLKAKDSRGSDGGDFLIHGPLRKWGPSFSKTVLQE